MSHSLFCHLLGHFIRICGTVRTSLLLLWRLHPGALWLLLALACPLLLFRLVCNRPLLRSHSSLPLWVLWVASLQVVKDFDRAQPCRLCACIWLPAPKAECAMSTTVVENLVAGVDTRPHTRGLRVQDCILDQVSRIRQPSTCTYGAAKNSTRSRAFSTLFRGRFTVASFADEAVDTACLNEVWRMKAIGWQFSELYGARATTWMFASCRSCITLGVRWTIKLCANYTIQCCRLCPPEWHDVQGVAHVLAACLPAFQRAC